MHDVDAGFFEVDVFEDGVGGADGGGGVVGGGAGADFAVEAHEGDEFFGEVVPGAVAFAGGVEEAGGVGFDDGLNLAGESPGPGGGAVLVVDDAESFLGFVDGAAEDGFEEVVAVDAVEPGGAEDGVAGVAFLDFAFAGEFAFAVDAGGGGCGFGVGLGTGRAPSKT